jgi:hypothetical protein
MIGAIIPILGIIMAAVTKPSPPKGMAAVDCPRCNARQNVPLAATYFQCWRCGLPGGQGREVNV